MLTNLKSNNNQSQLQRFTPEDPITILPMNEPSPLFNLNTQTALCLINSFYRLNPINDQWEKYDTDSQSWKEVSKKRMKLEIMKLQNPVPGQYQQLGNKRLEEIKFKVYVAQEFILKSIANANLSSCIYEGLSLSLFYEEVLRLYQEFPKSFIVDFGIL